MVSAQAAHNLETSLCSSFRGSSLLLITRPLPRGAQIRSDTDATPQELKPNVYGASIRISNPALLQLC